MFRNLIPALADSYRVLAPTTITNHGQRPWYEEGPPEGADYVR
jgi:hypothetical protein